MTGEWGGLGGGGKYACLGNAVPSFSSRSLPSPGPLLGEFCRLQPLLSSNSPPRTLCLKSSEKPKRICRTELKDIDIAKKRLRSYYFSLYTVWGQFSATLISTRFFFSPEINFLRKNFSPKID